MNLKKIVLGSFDPISMQPESKELENMEIIFWRHQKVKFVTFWKRGKPSTWLPRGDPVEQMDKKLPNQQNQQNPTIQASNGLCSQPSNRKRFEESKFIQFL